LAVGVLASTTYNNFIADLLFLSEVSHSLLVAGAPCVHPYLGKWALGPGARFVFCMSCMVGIYITVGPPERASAVILRQRQLAVGLITRRRNADWVYRRAAFAPS
jgi:hypothetical protein